MTIELTWLALAAFLNSIMWVPYVLNTIRVRGLVQAMGYESDPEPLSRWAERLKNAHYNSVENLVVFSTLVLIAHVADVHSGTTVAASVIYFFARLAHAIVYALGIPVLRTLTFALSWMCSVVLALTILL